MKILVLTHYWRPHIGGIETVAREQAIRLRRRGHPVTVLTSRLRDDPALMDDEGVVVRRVRALNPFESRGVPWPVFSPGLIRAVRASDADVVLAHGHTYLPTVIAAALAPRRLVVLQHNPLVAYGSPWRQIQRLADATLGRFAFRRAATVAAVSEHTASYVRSIVSGRPDVVLRSGVDVDRFAPAASEEERMALRRSFGLPLDRFVVLTVRRLAFRNGLDILADAASDLRDEPISFAIAGDGPQRAMLETRGLPNARFLGRVGDDRLPGLYRCADAFVLPTRSGEGFGLVLLEAAASGLPVVATRAGAQAEVVDDGVTGTLVSPDAAEIAKAIAGLVSDRAGAVAMGAAARKLALTQSWDDSIDRLEGILVEAIK